MNRGSGYMEMITLQKLLVDISKRFLQGRTRLPMRILSIVSLG